MSTGDQANFRDAIERAKAIAAKLKLAAGIGIQREEPVKPAPQKEKKVEIPDSKDVSVYQAPTTTIEIIIPSHMTGLLIGTGGQTLKTLESLCKVTIKLAEGKTESEKKAIVTGEDPCVQDAKERIEDIVFGKGALQILYGGPSQLGHETVYIQVPVHRVGLVIGRLGETIKILQEKSGAKINVVKEENDHLDTRTVVVSGPPNCIATAKTLIDEIVTDGSFASQFGPAGTSEVIYIPRDKVGLIIGKGGDTLKVIQNECNVRLNIDATGDVGGERPVTISGLPDSIQLAKEQIYDRVQGLRRGGAKEPEYGFADYGVAYDYSQYDPSQYQGDPKAYAQYYAQYYAAQGYTVDPEAQTREWDVGKEQADRKNKFSEHDDRANHEKKRDRSPRRDHRDRDRERDRDFDRRDKRR
ncbi:hypothetical protein HK103_004680 [Boothiomyces macroporosus]|uniref:K Homology domain-containing protein n=1 Tax=Boothiomyces macroporosus TaxID=261099 RepID=A0AAD5ULV4_9FUNG|nr:hypothetical protein HK103_004680 [Boothiomyces macroporosus]